jgi:hypothetical protein
MVLQAQQNGLFVRLAPDVIDKGVAILQYAEDTVLCLSHNPENAVNLKLLLLIFELMSSLKINFVKSEIFAINTDNEVTKFFGVFSVVGGELPMKYLGMPLTFVELKNVDWDFLDTKMLKKLDSWVGDSATSGGPLVLLRSSLFGIPYLYRSMLLLNKIFMWKPDKHIRGFFWSRKNKKMKILYGQVHKNPSFQKERGPWSKRSAETRH